jgi:NAD(P)H-hydrate epimerase
MLAEKTPAITIDQMREVDRLMIDSYRINLIQMMENAGRNLAVLTKRRFLNGIPGGKKVLVLAGSGGNGGGGLVAARHLHNWGAKIVVYHTRPVRAMRPVPSHQLDILTRMGVEINNSQNLDSLPVPDVILDAIIGYSLRGAPKGEPSKLIKKANNLAASGIPIMSLDMPSGMNATNGEARKPCICAAATMTLALPKTGLMADQARPLVGELYLADISVPRELYASMGLEVPEIFSREEIVRIY